MICESTKLPSLYTPESVKIQTWRPSSEKYRFVLTCTPMYLIISGTNRRNSFTLRIAKLYQSLLKKKNINAPVLSLIGRDLLDRNPSVIQLEKKWLLPASKYIFISPEYNGSIPGVLKCLIDVSDVSKVWKGKKALLTGVSKGRAGNLRGMDHLTGIMHYVGTIVHPNKLPISIVDTLFKKEELAHKETLAVINQQLEEFINF
jgi:chromate reductase, NAD(P)H dehydrogenase (quinone)